MKEINLKCCLTPGDKFKKTDDFGVVEWKDIKLTKNKRIFTTVEMLLCLYWYIDIFCQNP